MENFIINVNQINAILNILGEFPAKHVIGGIELLRNLPKQELYEKVEEVE